MDKKSVGIIGYGRTGVALYSFLRNDTAYSKIMIFDDNEIDRSGIHIGENDIMVELLCRENGITKLSEADLIIFSPGVNGREDRFFPLRSSGAKLVSELEFASNYIKSRIIAVTGTNGKSTTVSLIDHILKSSGCDSHLAGNIGIPLISEVNKIGEKSIAVLEVSSFQLEEINEFKPNITLILNITPDHLDRYPSFSDYKDAKLNILKNLSVSDPLILNYDDPFLRNEFYEKKDNKYRILWFSIENRGFNEGAWIDNGFVVTKIGNKKELISIAGNSLLGSHNLENILASFLALSLLDIPAKHQAEALGSFKGLSHRMEICGEKSGVRFINDSKATNVEATVKSISGINDDIALILGGKDKGGNFLLLKDQIGKKIKKIILIGEAADTISVALNSDKSFFTRANTLDEALRKGYEVLIGSGGSVLLAPGCASFDMFRNYEERGDVFKNNVKSFMDED